MVCLWDFPNMNGLTEIGRGTFILQLQAWPPAISNQRLLHSSIETATKGVVLFFIYCLMGVSTFFFCLQRLCHFCAEFIKLFHIKRRSPKAIGLTAVSTYDIPSRTEIATHSCCVWQSMTRQMNHSMLQIHSFPGVQGHFANHHIVCGWIQRVLTRLRPDRCWKDIHDDGNAKRSRNQY